MLVPKSSAGFTLILGLLAPLTNCHSLPGENIPVHCNAPEIQPWANQQWSHAATATRKKLRRVESEDWSILREIKTLFGADDPATVETVRSTLAKMDQKFHDGKNKLQFLEGKEIPQELINRAGPESQGVKAFVTPGGNTVYINKEKMKDDPVMTLVHEMSHLAAATRDHGYVAMKITDDLNNGVNYWDPEGGTRRLPTEKLVRNADTYALFILRFR